MDDLQRSRIIKDNPIGKCLDTFRTSFNSICEKWEVECTPDALFQLDQKELWRLALLLLLPLQQLPVAGKLHSKIGRGSLQTDLDRLIATVASNDFDPDRIRPLLKAALAGDPDDMLIWGLVYNAISESTPPPRPMASSLQQTPWCHHTSSFVNSSEYRKDVDKFLKNELGTIYVGIPRFCETFFGRVAGLDTASEAVFKKCIEGSKPLFSNGWSGWPTDVKQDDVLSWFAELNEKLATFSEEYKSTPTNRRRPLAQPNKPIQDSIADRKLDIGFVDDPKAGKDSRCRWSQILVPGELKNNPSADIPSKAWLDLSTYAREVLAAQDTRRFVLGFTICGSLMRIWEFDRLGGIASEQFDINKDGQQFVYIVLGFFWMSKEQLGFDPTIITLNSERFIEIKRNGLTERLIIDEVIQRTRCIAGRATTCWKAYLEGQPRKPFVIKDSWQYPERDEEGEMLCEVTGKGVVNIARYYYHETVQVYGADDDIQNNVRGGLEITGATNYRPERSTRPTSAIASGASQKRRSSRIAGKKRSLSQTSASLPPSKRSCSVSSTNTGGNALLNRIHRRVILSDYGKPIYKASSRLALLAALEGCIKGHESLRKVGLLHRDISIGNLMINEDKNNPSWYSFIIDLDLAIREQREGPSGAKGKTGTRAFMAIGVLLGEQHSFMHDLESFFWVLFWICVHYDGQGKGIYSTVFESWNYLSDIELATVKKGEIVDEEDFLKRMDQNFTSYYRPLIPWVNRLRRKVFPDRNRWKKPDPELYSSMKEILSESRKDPKVSADTIL